MTRAFAVSAPATGTGKTTVSLGLMAALRARGLTVQPFKVGPDYIDPAYHTRVCERPSINLDPWMTSETFVRDTFYRHCAGAEIAVVEGVMGLFDSAGQGDGAGSTAHVAKLLGIPVVLVVDGYSSAESLAAHVLGCEQFDPELHVAGAIVNRHAGDSHLASVRGAIDSACSSPFLGALPNVPDISLPERQLGLMSVYEHGLSGAALQRLSALVEKHVDLEAVLSHAATVPSSGNDKPSGGKPLKRARIGVARDRAFCFYYEDNLRLIEDAGAELIAFSPLDDARLPEGLQGLYLGGGFPEEFAPELSENAPIRDALRGFQGGVLAECGGLIYLCESFRDRNGTELEMAGRVPGAIEMTGALQGFGYRDATCARDCLLGPKGTRLRGHEFHWSRWIRHPNHGWGAFTGEQGVTGYADATTLASYFHVHLGSHPASASHFVERCAAQDDE